MKNVLLGFSFLAAAGLVAWAVLRWDDPLPAAWQALRFRWEKSTQEEARQLLTERKALHEQRLAAGFETDLTGEIRREMELWEEQFHLGEADRTERLALQRLTVSNMRRRVREDLLDGAFLESRLTTVTEAAARAWYAAHVEELRLPVLHRVSHIFLSRHIPGKPDRRVEMQSIQRELKEGMAFAKLAARRSEDARSKSLGGELGWLSEARMPEDFMKQLERLRVGEVSGLVETKLGWHLLLVTERRPSRLPAFEEVRDEIVALLDFQQRQKP